MRVLLKVRNKNYEDGLKILKLDSLEQRRNKLTLNLAKSSLKLEKMKQLFPMNLSDCQMERRNFEKFKVRKARTERFKSSAVISMQNMLNEEENLKLKTYKNVISPVLRTCGSSESISLRKFTYK